MKNNVPSVGEAAPDFAAATSQGGHFQLSTALQSGKNLVLIFYRGHW